MSNPGWEYYRRLTGSVVEGPFTVEKYTKAKQHFKSLKSAGVPAHPEATHEEIMCLQHPGLIVGTGLTGGRKRFDGEKEIDTKNWLHLGYQFDYTTGMPVIPGSSVKGSVRSWFPLRYEGADRDRRFRYIAKLLNSVGVPCDGQTEQGKALISKLEMAVFEGLDEREEALPVPTRDVFFDALPSEDGEALFAYDFITPHLNRAEPAYHDFAEPIPIEFLKVRGGVQFRFSGKFTDSTFEEGTVSASAKWQLILRIIQDWGVGAKTRVGYGTFIPAFVQAEMEKAQDAAASSKMSAIVDFRGKVGPGTKIIVQVEAGNKVKASINGQEWRFNFTHRTPLEVGKIIEVEVKSVVKKHKHQIDKFIQHLALSNLEP